MGRTAMCDDDEFLRAVEEVGVKEVAVRYGYSGEQAVRNRIARLRKALEEAPPSKSEARVYLEIKNGTVVIGSDMHYWPGIPPSTAHLAMVRLIRELGPDAVIANGDVIDAPSVSRHSAIGWEKRPALWDEVLVAQERLDEIELAAPNAFKIWNLGNHDARFETFLAGVAHQYRGVKGIHLKDHFPAWTPAWAAWINEATDLCVTKHRLTGNLLTNIKRAGCHIVTGHQHKMGVEAWTTYRQTFYGVDTGMIAVPHSEPFTNYTEDNPMNWRSGVTVLSFHNGKMLPPEQLIVLDQARRLTAFRGQVYQEKQV